MHEAAVWGMVVASGLLFVGTLLVVPWIVVRIPSDYFHHTRRPPPTWMPKFAPFRLAAMVVKNIAGVLLIAAGVAMLVLPGQGLLTILVGVLMLDFPGKYHFERWLVGFGPTLRAINWLRQRAGREPLVVLEDS